jgi:orotidine-5'-phosphate decarboxylase
MKKGKDFIIFALDVGSEKKGRAFVRMLADQVGYFKIGLELFIRSGRELIDYIQGYSSAKIFLDLKLHDIPMTVKRAMESISDLGVDLTTVHCGENRKMLDMAVEGSRGKVGVLGVTLLTSVGANELYEAGFADKYTADLSLLVEKRASSAFAAGCQGVVCAGLEASRIKNATTKDFLVITPGIRPTWEGLKKDDQSRITTPSEAVSLGADYIVVGRPIRDAKNPPIAARKIADEIETVL